MIKNHQANPSWNNKKRGRYKLRHGRDAANFKTFIHENNTRLLESPSLVNFDFIMNSKTNVLFAYDLFTLC